MLELNRIYNFDCIEGMKQIESGEVDLIVTDPPYCIAYKTGWRADDHRFSKEILNDDNEQLIIDYMSECYRILKDDSAAYIFCALLERMKDRMDKHQILKECIENLALLTQLGVSIAVPPILCLLAANWLRGKWGLGLWIMIVALVLGLGGSASNVWKFWKQLKKREERETKK